VIPFEIEVLNIGLTNSGSNQGANKLLRKMLQVDPEKRATLEEVMDHQ
jgi:serine/threonine protein kinase